MCQNAWKCLTDAGFEVVPGVQLLRIQLPSLMNFIRVENSTTSYLTPLRENREAISMDPVYTRYDTSTHCQLQRQFRTVAVGRRLLPECERPYTRDCPPVHLNLAVSVFNLAHAASRAFLSASFASGCSPLRINP